MSAVILAQSIYNRREYLELRGEIGTYVDRLASYRIFSIGEIASIAGISEYRVRRFIDPDHLIRVKSGVHPRHLEFLLRMIDNSTFSRVHVKMLVMDGATLSGLSRVTGQSESSLRRWAREE